jgi:hypothetical protein
MQNPHSLPNKPNKTNFHKNYNVFFPKYLYIDVGNMLLVDDTPCKIIFNAPYIGIFLEFFDGLCGHDNYLLGTILPYLESFHSSEYGVSIFVQHNPFSRIRCISNHDDPRQFKMLFLKCNCGRKPSFYNNAKWKLKQNVPY